METETKYLKYIFSEEEKKALADELTQKITAKNELEMKKKEVAAQIKAEIDAADSIISQYSTHYNQGYMFKDIDCRVERDYEAREVHYYRLDTGELAEKRKMTADELQKGLFPE